MSGEISKEQFSTLHIRISKSDTVTDIDIQLEPSYVIELLKALCSEESNPNIERFIDPRLQTDLDPDLLDIPVGYVIKGWREHRGLKLTELASMTKIPKGYISQIEHGKIQMPNSAVLRKLSAALELSPWDIIHRQYPEPNE